MRYMCGCVSLISQKLRCDFWRSLANAYLDVLGAGHRSHVRSRPRDSPQTLGRRQRGHALVTQLFQHRRRRDTREHVR
eukprot:1406140-Rhodomonas_salina.1